MNAKRKKILPKDNTKLLELVDEDGIYAVIKKSAITGVFGNNKSSTICFDGQTVTTKFSLKEALTFVGFCKDTA